MKKYIVLTFIILFSVQECLAATSSFKTFTPFMPQYEYNNNGYFMPPPPPPPESTNSRADRIWRRNNYYNHLNGYNNNYYYNNYPYNNYYQPRRTIFSAIGDFFSGGKMTGYTTTDFTDNPYGYQESQKDSNGNNYYKNYGYKNGATIKILD